MAGSNFFSGGQNVVTDLDNVTQADSKPSASGFASGNAIWDRTEEKLYKSDGTSWVQLSASAVGKPNWTSGISGVPSALVNGPNAASGVATLDANTKVVERLSYEGSASGVATLNSSSNVPASQLGLAALLAGATFTGTVNVSSGELQVSGDQVAEYGSNSNGEYVRFYNSWQVCWYDALTLTHDNANRLNAVWTFPAAFASGPTVSVFQTSGNLPAGAAKRHFSQHTDPATTTEIDSVQVRNDVDSPYASGDEVNAEIATIGLWK